jgi:hypothetical protein
MIPLCEGHSVRPALASRLQMLDGKTGKTSALKARVEHRPNGLVIVDRGSKDRNINKYAIANAWLYLAHESPVRGVDRCVPIQVRWQFSCYEGSRAIEA